LDPQSRQGLLKTLQQLQKEGHSIVLSSHNMEDIAELAQEMTILQQGKSVATAAVGELFGASSMLQEAYLLAPGGAVLAAQFRAKGWPIPLEVVTLTGLKACLAQLLGSQPG
jgi:energy-coupling factor transport system ATP-binding protein